MSDKVAPLCTAKTLRVGQRVHRNLNGLPFSCRITRVRKHDVDVKFDREYPEMSEKKLMPQATIAERRDKNKHSRSRKEARDYFAASQVLCMCFMFGHA